MQWRIEPDVDLFVFIGAAGPFDEPFGKQLFDVTSRVRGEDGITVKRGRSDEFTAFQAGSCSLTLKNDNREFDPSLTGTWLEVPGLVGSTASTPDSSIFAVTDLDVRAQVTMDDWTPGGFGVFLVSQYAIGNISWVLGVSASGQLQLVYSTDGSATTTATGSVPGFTDGTEHWVRATLDVNNGAGGRDIKFYTSTDGVTWTQLGSTITTAGTITLFNSTANLAVADVLPFAGKVRRVEVRNGIGGGIVANPDFTGLPPGTKLFIDGRGNVWAINGTALVAYDDQASPFAAVLKPSRLLAVAAQYAGVLRFLFVGFIDGWPRTWSKTTGSVRIEAHDLIRVMARTQTSPSLGGLVLNHPDDGKLDIGRLAGDLPQQFSGERIRALLQLAGFGGPGQLLDIDRGLTEVVAEEPSGNILSLIQSAETAEAGFFFVAADGTIRFRDRHSRFQESRTGTVQAVFTDNQYMALEVDHDLTQVWNDVAFTRPDGLEQRVVDDASAHDYGYISLRDQLPVVSDAEAQARAEFFVDRYGTPQDRPGSVVISPRKNMPVLFPRVIDRELLDRIQIQRTPLGVGPTATFTGLVESIEHRITNESWTTILTTSPIDVSEGEAFLVLDDTTLGQLDFHTLAY